MPVALHDGKTLGCLVAAVVTYSKIEDDVHYSVAVQIGVPL